MKLKFKALQVIKLKFKRLYKKSEDLKRLYKDKSKFVSINNKVRDYTDVETPCSISNQEAKHIVGDDTKPYWQGESSSLRTLLKFYYFCIHIKLS